MDRHRLVGMFEKACRDLEESLQPDVVMLDETKENILKNYDIPNVEKVIGAS